MNRDKNVIYTNQLASLLGTSYSTAHRKMCDVKQYVWNEYGLTEEQGKERRNFVTPSEVANFFCFDQSLKNKMIDDGFSF